MKTGWAPQRIRERGFEKILLKYIFVYGDALLLDGRPCGACARCGDNNGTTRTNCPLAA